MRRIAIRPAESDEDGINFPKNLRVVALKNPTTLGLIIRVEDTQPLGLPVRSFLLRPNLVLIIGLLHLCFVQVVGVEDEGLALSEEDPAKSGAGFPSSIRIHDIHDVEIARAHQVRNIAAQTEQLAFLVEGGGRFF